MKKICLALLISIYSINSFAFSEGLMFGEKSNSGIDPIEYNLLLKKIKDVESRYSKFATVERVGMTVRSQEIVAVVIRDKDVSPKKLILVTGATHGNEYLNIEDSLLDEFLKKENREFYDFYKRGGVLIVIPIFNVDGYSMWGRSNANGKDLNRDFANYLVGYRGFSEIESQGLKDYIEQFIEQEQVKLVLNMDYHCCYNGTLLFPWGYKKESIPQADTNRFNKFGKLMQKYFPRNKYGKVSDYVWYTAKGTTLDYWYLYHNSVSLTYEGKRGGEASSLREHVLWWKDIVKEFR